jgi:carboxylesterase
MTQHPRPDPSAFFLQGDSAKGALLVHGFTGSPPEMRLIGDYLNERGYTVSAPLLPGHGTEIENMNQRRWPEWAAHVGSAYDALSSVCSRVVVGGLSMGALLSLNLAAGHPEVPALALYAPAIRVTNWLIYLAPLMKHFIPVWSKSGTSDLGDPDAELRLWHYRGYPVAAAHELMKLMRHVRRQLPRVTCPAVVFHAAQDKHIREPDLRREYERLGSRDRQFVVLSESGHALTVDLEWRSVAQRTYTFFEQRLAQGASGSA